MTFPLFCLKAARVWFGVFRETHVFGWKYVPSADYFAISGSHSHPNPNTRANVIALVTD